MTDAPTDRSMSDTDEPSDDTDETTPDDEPASDEDASPLPETVVDEAERLTRLARDAAGDEAATYCEARAETLDEHGYTARVRDEDETLVLYPDAWLDGDTVRMERIDDTDRAVEVPLSATAGEGEWADIEAHNAELVERVADEYGQPHAANVRAFADFMGNHYLTRIDAATADHCREFLDEYYPRNAWASAAQREAVEDSLAYAFAVADADSPLAASDE